LYKVLTNKTQKLLQNNTYKIQIKEPCKQNWQQMTATTAGKYCNNCATEVIDFTNYSDTQIIDYIKQNGITSGCGRFLNTQLEQIRIVIDEDISTSSLSYWKKFMIALLICFGGHCLNAEVSLGQIIKQDTSLQKNECDTFNTGESYKLAEKSLVGDIIDTTVTDTSTLVLDTAILKKKDLIKSDTLKFVWDTSNIFNRDLDVEFINCTVGFMVPTIIEKSIMFEEILVPNIDVKSTLTPRIQKDFKTEIKAIPTIEIPKPNNKRKSPAKQEDSIPTNAILPEEKSRKRRRKK
jgi:hypothetical protein